MIGKIKHVRKIQFRCDGFGVIGSAPDKPLALNIECARTCKEILRGLMYRTSLPEDSGMLFDFGIVLCSLCFLLPTSTAAAQELDFNRGMELYDINRYDGAIEAFTASINKDYRLADAYFYRASAYYHTNRYRKALKDLEEVLKTDPAYYPALNMKGTILLESGKVQEAMDNYQQCIDIQPGYDTAYYNMAIILYEELDDAESALAYLDEAILINDSDPDYFHFRGQILSCLNRPEEAEQAILQATSMKHTSPEYWSDLADVYDKLERYPEALYCIGEAFSLDETNTCYRLQRGNYLLSLGEPEQGREIISSVFLEDPENTEYIYQMVWAYYLSDMFEPAILLSLEIGSETEYADDILPLRAHSYYMLDLYDKALNDITRAFELQAGDYYNWYLRGVIENVLSRHLEAEEHLTRAVLLYPSDAATYYERGIARSNLDNKDGACLDWGIASAQGHEEALEQVRHSCNELEF